MIYGLLCFHFMISPWAMKDFGSTKGSSTQRSGPAENCCRLAFSPCNLLGYLKTAHEGFLGKYFMFKA